MNIYGEKVILRALEQSDMEYLRELVNDPEFEYQVVGYSMPISSTSQIKWFERQDGKKDDLRLAVQYEGKIVGMATLNDIDWKNRKAFHGMKLGREAQGKGIGKDVVFAIMKFAFMELQLNRLEGGMLETNDRSIAMYLKCGWKKEGIFREFSYKNGRYLDYIPVSVLKSDYEAILKLK